MLWHIFKNGWEDKEFINQRVYGMDEVRQEIEKWTPDEVERVTGIPEAQVRRVAETFAKQKPACLIWAMGQTQHTVGTANVRASCILVLATGNIGNLGAGANPFRGHDNVQGASDMGVDITSLPLYYGLTEEAWKHWSPSLGGRVRVVARPLRQSKDDEHGGHSSDALVRRDNAAEGPGRAKGQPQGHGRIRA